MSDSIIITPELAIEANEASFSMSLCKFTTPEVIRAYGEYELSLEDYKNWLEEHDQEPEEMIKNGWDDEDLYDVYEMRQKFINVKEQLDGLFKL